MSIMGKIYREAGRVADMINKHHASHLTMNDCIRGDAMYWFNQSPESMSFAIAVVEDKPVFVGDKLWHTDGSEYEVQATENINGRLAFKTIRSPFIDGDFVDNYTWEIPDEYAHLRQAVAEGKRIAWQSSNGEWSILIGKPRFEYPTRCYKIIEDDKKHKFSLSVFGRSVDVIYTECALTGKIRAEVLQ